MQDFLFTILYDRITEKGNKYMNFCFFYLIILQAKDLLTST